MSSEDPDPDAHTVYVDPGGVEVKVQPGESLMGAAQRSGMRWPNVCGGEAMCGICFVRVLEGAEYAPPIGPPEQTRLNHTGRSKDPSARLACQLRVGGPMTVFKRGVRPAS